MAPKKQRDGSIPKGNRPRDGSVPTSSKDQANLPRVAKQPITGTGFQEQDAKKRLGSFGGAGEHPLVQPGGKHGDDR